MTIWPLGDTAWMLDLGDDRHALALAEQLRAAKPPGVEDVVGAYNRVAAIFDPLVADADTVRNWLTEAAVHLAPPRDDAGRLHRVPCCYERGPDLPQVAELLGLTPAEVISLHAGRKYRVCAVGFVMGFPYLGYLPDELAGVARLPSPRVRVEQGSIGLTGRQTGIYPAARPGGWRLIGQTPLTICEPSEAFFPIRPGDRVQFEAIDAAEFARRAGQRLELEN